MLCKRRGLHKNIKTYSSCLFNDSHYNFWVNLALLFVVNMICLIFQIKKNDDYSSCKKVMRYIE